MAWKRAFLFTLLSVFALTGSILWVNLLQAADPAPTNQTMATFPVIADFEGGVPADWFQYGDGGTTVIPVVETISDTASLALPGQIGNNDVLSVTANVPTWAGFGAALNPVSNWNDYDALSFWFYGDNSGTTYTVEIQTVPGDDRRATFVEDFMGWQQIILPFHTFGAGGAYDVSQVDNWVFVLDGVVDSFVLDNLQLVNLQPFADFEGGVPAGWFQYGDGGTTVIPIVETISDTAPIALPGQIGNNDILSVTANVPTWAGFGAAFNPVADWSDMQGVSFWFYGENSGTTHEFELQTVQGDDRRVEFVDDFTGWQLLTFPFNTFGAGGTYDVSQVDNWVFVLDGTDGAFYLDHLSAYGDAATIPVRVQFDPNSYAVAEGETATITVALNVTSTETVMVDYATMDDTAVAGVDYTPVTGTLTFTAGEMTQSFTVQTIDNSVEDGDRSLQLMLSNPVSATLGAANTAVLLIQDNEQPSVGKTDIVDDFESGLPEGVDGDGNGIGFVTWGDTWAGTTVAITTTQVGDADPLAVPGQSGDNYLFQIDLNVNGWGGSTHAFENEAVDTWVPQDWSGYVGISFWLYGQNTGNDLLFEINENRNPGSTVADTEIWSYAFVDDFSGWQQIVLNFDDDFVRKEIGNGAPNDGFTREEVHGWAFGSLATGGADVTYYLDDVALVVRTEMIDDFESGLPEGVDGDGNGIGFVTWGDTWAGTTVAITTTLVADNDPLAVPGQSGDTNIFQIDLNVNGWGGMTHAFENEAVDTWVPQDWSSFEGICFWVYGQNTGNDLLFEINENRNPGSTIADTEIWSHGFVDDFSGWRLIMLDFDDDFIRKEIGNGAPNDGFTREQVHGWAFGSLATGGADVTYYLEDVMIYGNTGSDQPLSVAFDLGKVSVNEGDTAELVVELSREHDQAVTVDYTTAEANAREGQQYTPVSGTLTFPAGTLTQTISIPTHHDGKHTRDVRVAVNLYEGTGAPLGFQRRSVLTIVDIDPADPRLVDDFQGAHPFIYQDGMVELSITTLMEGESTAVPGQMAYEDVLTVEYDGASSFSRIFSQGQDWSAYEGLSVWVYGQNSGETITYELRDNMAATTAEVDPEDWVLVWSDEFNDPMGTPPNGNVWGHELGDGALNDIVGWGNSEFQYYTDSTDNSFMDGNGNLVIRLEDTPNDTDLVCWYGPCEYTSARLLTQDHLDFEYGRIEARVQVPDGPSGLWPAFWMLGTDIPEVGWPQTGEIDIMEYVSRLPNEVFGTIHGPGYAGGASYGNTLTFTDTVPNQGYLTYGVEWMPDHIIWYVDDVQYHQAIPANVAPNEWVFNHPFFMLLNAAIGGNFGGAIADNMPMPQDTLVDYVRVYQAADTAERFETTFVDDFSGWRQVYLPFSDFVRSADQPAGAPDDGLGLTEVWGYGFILPESGDGLFHMDRVYLEETIPDTYLLTVTADGAGSGLVTSDPAGINCGVSCAAEFEQDSVVTLTAVADAGSVFAGWTGAVTSSDPTIEVTMDAAQNITATFDLEEVEPTTYYLFLPFITR